MVLVKQIKSANDLENCFEKSDSFFLFIYANWCGHCKEMKPDMEKFKKEVGSKPQNIFIGCIEETALKTDPRINEVLTKYNIEPQGYPTIVYGEKNKEPTELKGERNLDNFNNIFNELCKGITTQQTGGRRRRRKRRTAKKRKRKRRRHKTVKKGGISLFRHRKKPDASLFHLEDFKTGEETINPFLAVQREEAYKKSAEAFRLSQEPKNIKLKRPSKEKPKKINLNRLFDDKSRVPELTAPKQKTFLPLPPKGGRKKTRKRKRKRKRHTNKKRKNRK